MDSVGINDSANAKSKRKRGKRRGKRKSSNTDRSVQDVPSDVEDTEDQDIEAMQAEVFDDVTDNCAANYNLVTDARPSYIPQRNEVPPDKEEEKDEELRYQGAQSDLENLTSDLINNRPLPASAETYGLETFQKKLLYIFNQVDIDDFNEKRKGTEKDYLYLQTLFSKYDFEIKPYTDLTESEIFVELDELKTKNYTDYGCIGVVVLTHGTNNGMLWAKDLRYQEGKILNYFKSDKNPSLLTKPKFLIIQACRGDKEPAGITVGQEVSFAKLTTDFSDDVQPYTIPVEADILVLHSSYYGNPSHRHEEEGSWFIQTLCRKIEEMSHTHDLEKIMKAVKREVAVDKEHQIRNRRTNQVDINKQMPVMTSTLFRELYLKKYDGSSQEEVKFDVEEKELAAVSKIDHDGDPGDAAKSSVCYCESAKFPYLRHALQSLCSQFPDQQDATVVYSTMKHFENDPRFEKSTLNNMILPIVKNKSISCFSCKETMLYIRGRTDSVW